MAELSYWWTTSGTPSGDQQASYTQVHLSTISAILAACGGFEGVAPSYLNELACTANGANTVAVATGGALVDGKPYLNDASQDVNIPSAVGGGNTRIDRLVLRADWANFNVSVYRIAGTDAASPTAPAITQTSGTTYDIQLCQVLVDTSGAVTVTDERVLASAFRIREGGSASDWATAGTTDYFPAGVRWQMGSRQYAVSSGAVGISISFPVAFSGTPLVFATLKDVSGNTSARLMVMLVSISASAFSGWIRADDLASTWDGTYDLYWLAIGPE